MTVRKCTSKQNNTNCIVEIQERKYNTRLLKILLWYSCHDSIMQQTYTAFRGNLCP